MSRDATSIKSRLTPAAKNVFFLFLWTEGWPAIRADSSGQRLAAPRRRGLPEMVIIDEKESPWPPRCCYGHPLGRPDILMDNPILRSSVLMTKSVFNSLSIGIPCRLHPFHGTPLLLRCKAMAEEGNR